MKNFDLIADDSTRLLLRQCEALYRKAGFEGITFKSLKEAGIYNKLYSKGINKRKIIELLGLDDDYSAYKISKRAWNWKKIVKEILPIVIKLGFLPPAGWFQSNNNAHLVAALYSINKTWADLRKEFDSFATSNFVESRNGIRWLSHPEASLSNFLHARGINHRKGERYPDDYSEISGQKYGYYDLHFLSANGEIINVEIWGDRPNGHNEDGYAKVRSLKEDYNKNDKNFIGIHFTDCYDDEKLAARLKPYIGQIKPYIFSKPSDKIIPSTHWSNSDELIEYCREIAKKQPGEKFPTEEWLRKRGKWKAREGETYNTLSIYIKKWLGGVRNLRKILGQNELSTSQWNKEIALSKYKEWYRVHGITARQATHNCRKGADKFTRDECLLATNISAAIDKYVGGTMYANKILGISIIKQSKWNKESVLDGYKKYTSKYNLSLNQILYLSKKEQLSIPVNERKEIGQLIGASTRYYSGAAEIYHSINFSPPRLPYPKNVKRHKKIT